MDLWDIFSYESTAYFSHDRKYRYSLSRMWDASLPSILFIGLNPSTANESVNDPTIRKVMKFAAIFGYGKVYMGNCFPFISTDPNQLNALDNIAKNDHELSLIKRTVSEVVFAWGAFDIVKESGRDKALSAMFPDAKCLIKNKDGSPRHPLYVPYLTKLIKW